MNRKDRSVFLDPCQEAAAKSIRCLHRNGGDRTMCSDYFQLVMAAETALRGEDIC